MLQAAAAALPARGTGRVCAQNPAGGGVRMVGKRLEEPP